MRQIHKILNETIRPEPGTMLLWAKKNVAEVKTIDVQMLFRN